MNPTETLDDFPEYLRQSTTKNGVRDSTESPLTRMVFVEPREVRALVEIAGTRATVVGLRVVG